MNNKAKKKKKENKEKKANDNDVLIREQTKAWKTEMVRLFVVEEWGRELDLVLCLIAGSHIDDLVVKTEEWKDGES